MYINLLTLIRKIVHNEKILSERQFLLGELIEIAKEKVKKFDEKLNQILSQQEKQGKNQQPGQLLEGHRPEGIVYLEDVML